MSVQKDKAFKWIMFGMALQFFPLFIAGMIAKSINYLPNALRISVFILVLIAFLIGGGSLIKGCTEYIKYKGYSAKLGWLGLLSILGLLILMFIPSKICLAQLKEEELGGSPLGNFNVAELLLQTMLMPGIFITFLLGIYCWFNNLNLIFILNDRFTLGLIATVLGLLSLIFLLKQCGFNVVEIKNIIGHKNTINLKLIAALAIISYGFSRGFNSIALFNLSFIFPDYVMDRLNERNYQNIPDLVYSGISTLLITPLLIEIIFRGLILQKWSIKWNVRTGVLASALLFAIIPFRYDVLTQFLFGIILAILYFKSSNIISPILFYSFRNLLGFINAALTFFSEMPSERSRLITILEFQNLINQFLGLRVFVVAISAPVLIYFIYKNFPRNEAIIPYYVNADKEKERVQT